MLGYPNNLRVGDKVVAIENHTFLTGKKLVKGKIYTISSISVRERGEILLRLKEFEGTGIIPYAGRFKPLNRTLSLNEYLENILGGEE